MINVKREGILMEATGLDFEIQAVLNPACIQTGDIVHVFYRAVREFNHSTIGYAQLEGPKKILKRAKEPLLVPEFSWEQHGLEDPRLVLFENLYYLFYTAYDGMNARVAYATSHDLIKWKKRGLISPNFTYDLAEDYFRENKSHLKDKYFWFESYFKDMVSPAVLLWEKNSFILPKRINGQMALIHRILPDMQVIYFRDFPELTDNYWAEYLKNISKNVVLEPMYGFESRNIGGGAPFLETPVGWLNIYHAVQDLNSGRVYHAAAALHDKNDPTKVIGRLEQPLFSPQESYEKQGDVNNVVFPTGLSVFDKRLYIYYGAADKRIAIASVNLEELLAELQQNSKLVVK